MQPFLHSLRRPLSVALLAAAAVLMARTAFGFSLVARWDIVSLGPLLRRWCDPFLAGVSHLLGVPWSPDGLNMLPIGLAIVLLLAYVVLDAALGGPQARARAARAAVPAPRPPVPAPGPRPRTVVSPTGTMYGSNPVPPPTAAAVPMPARIGRYEVEAEVGRGAMGIVYKARDPQLSRTVAIKTIIAGAASDPGTAQYLKRVQVEARAAGRLLHPGIVSVYDLTEDAAHHPCLVLEFVEGATLAALADSERLSLERCYGIVIQVARALDYAHRQGVVHRDIKPANIMMTRDGAAKVTDFGVAKVEGTQLTLAGEMIGTPAFMSPEQCTDAPVDARSDIFSLGCVLYWLCTGQPPFEGTGLSATIYKVVHQPPPPPRELNPELPSALDAVFDRCLAKAPAERYRSAEAFALDLEAVRGNRELPSAAARPPAAGAPAPRSEPA